MEAISPLVSRVKEMTSSGELDRLTDPATTKALIDGPERTKKEVYRPELPDPVIAKRIIANIFLAPSGSLKLNHIQWEKRILHRRRIELNALKEELKMMVKSAVKQDKKDREQKKDERGPHLKKKQAYDALQEFYTKRVDAVNNFFSVFLASLSNTIDDITVELTKKEAEEDRLLAKRDIYSDRMKRLDAKRDELIELGAAKIKEEPFLEAAKEIFDAMKSARNAIPIIIASVGWLGITIGERIKDLAKTYLSHVTIVDQFFHSNFPVFRYAAGAALLGGLTWLSVNIYRKAKMYYKSMKTNSENFMRIVRIKRIVNTVKLRIQNRIDRPRDILRAKRVLLVIDLPDEKLKSEIETAQKTLLDEMEEANYPFSPECSED